jgi:gamma-glutamyltranspeptidase/glutathione hydrolase
MGTRYMVSAGHYLATQAGIRVLEAGGNAIDAGVAAGLCLNVVQADVTQFGGVAPICVYRSDTGQVETISGLGWWPAASNAQLFHDRYGGRIPPGIHRSVIPAAADAWLTALERHGTMSLSDVAEPAIDLADNGFPMHSVMLDTFTDSPGTVARMRSWPSTREVFLPCEGRPVGLGELVIQKDLASTFRMLCEAERGARSRDAGIRAARSRFYTGDIAEAMAAFCAREGGWLTLEDLASFHVGIEAPVAVSYHGYDVFACGPWCQGPVVPMTLNILSGYDLTQLEPTSTRLYHLILEALKAAFADRDRYFTDPRFGDVPMDGLLSPEYGAHWRDRISCDAASPAMPVPGDAWAFSAHPHPAEPDTWTYPEPTSGQVEPDTSYLCVVDRQGNAFSATPSDGATSSPLVPGLGFAISSRGMQSWLDQGHPSRVAPGRRPRLTPSPGMVLKDGRLVMPYGTPGNDVQPQAMTQFLINVIDFGMDVQAAIEAPRCATYSYPRSSDPHPYAPGSANLEGRAGPDVLTDLRALGHDIRAWPDWTGSAGSVSAIRVDDGAGVLFGGADPRRIAYAAGR